MFITLCTFVVNENSILFLRVVFSATKDGYSDTTYRLQVYVIQQKQWRKETRPARDEQRE